MHFATRIEIRIKLKKLKFGSCDLLTGNSILTEIRKKQTRIRRFETNCAISLYDAIEFVTRDTQQVSGCEVCIQNVRYTIINDRYMVCITKPSNVYPIKREEEVEKAVVDERANANRHKPATAIICMQTNSFDDKAFYPQSTSQLMR